MKKELKTLLEEFIVFLGGDIKKLKAEDTKLQGHISAIEASLTKIGDLTTLTTTEKTSLVKAINELKASIGAFNTSTDENAVNLLIDNKINALVNNAPEALNTLKEIADKLQADETTATALAGSVSKKVDFSSAQTLSTEQQKQAQENIGLGDLTTLNLIDTYTTARDSQ